VSILCADWMMTVGKLGQGIGDLPLIITISDTCKNQPKRLDFDNTINLSSLIVSLVSGSFETPSFFRNVHVS
jgi:hypothetical protein